ncbi:MAG: hypothetical protein ACRCZS_06735 [Chroococcidiopsis sp.]
MQIKIAIPRGTCDRLQSVFVAHSINPGFEMPGNRYFTQTQYEHIVQALKEPAKSYEGIEALIKELGYYFNHSTDGD